MPRHRLRVIAGPEATAREDARWPLAHLCPHPHAETSLKARTRAANAGESLSGHRGDDHESGNRSTRGASRTGGHDTSRKKLAHSRRRIKAWLTAPMLRQTFPGSTLLAMTTALLVIDAQQGLCKGEHQAFESARVISRINRVYAAACARH